MSHKIPPNCREDRELSWLKFNRRVLAQTEFADTPLFEKLNFLRIFARNLDEFFMVRVGELTDRTLMKNPDCSARLKQIFAAMPELCTARDAAQERLEQELSSRGFTRLQPSDLEDGPRRRLRTYFTRRVLPLLSPVLVDALHPFPHLENLKPYLAARIKTRGGVQFGLVHIKEQLDPLVFLPDGKSYLLMEDLFIKYAHLIFAGMKPDMKCIVRVTRNADIDISDRIFDEDEDYPASMKKLLKLRERLAPVRLEIRGGRCKAVETWLTKRLSLSSDQVLHQSAPLSLSYISALEPKLQDEKYPPFRPVLHPDLSPDEPVIPRLCARDILLCPPRHSLQPIIRLIDEAGRDRSTVSIKICLYRLASDSRVIQSLCTAAENGVDVTALLELRARFDEQNNIDWAAKLIDSGVTVLYGVEDYKVHSKLLLITRKIHGDISYITHVSTGNYNESTARTYTDLGLITANPAIGADAARLFRSLSLSQPDFRLDTMAAAPAQLKDTMLRHISRQIQNAHADMPAAIRLKMNSLTDKELMDALIRASRAGVKVELAVRGICCLRSGVPGFTHNIRVRSIVGRFLEHSRIFIFGEGEESTVYISSADWMTRNTRRRVELACPILDPEIKSQVTQIFQNAFWDNHRAWEQCPDGSYAMRPARPPILDSQSLFLP